MNKINIIWRSFINYILDNKKKLINNYIVFFVSICLFLMFDLLTKYLLFDKEGGFDLLDGEVSDPLYDFGLFGIRILKHYGLTFVKGTINVGLVTFFNVLILIACAASILILRKWWNVIFIALIFSGALGNTIDRLGYGYVRDIIFLPWLDRGTFNIADAEVVIGSLFITISLIIHMIIDFFNERR